ncbi:MAG: hypothetical protein D6785_04780 [Planctomycetota bacterium]|nr:MAG: hypothetical protein D6785_04780 [Planctomycetota bacterium]
MSDFSFVLPAEIQKSGGEWVISGLASTPSRDRQKEVVLPDGMDLSPIDEGKGIINFEHLKGPENLVGVLDSYKKTPNGLFIKGRLFKNHKRAKAIYEIMSSLNKADKGRVGLSVEGKILERDSKDPAIIKKCKITGVAITFNPVNQDTYADLAKSMSFAQADLEFDTEETEEASEPQEAPKNLLFTPEQVVELIQKALSTGGAYATSTPAQLSGGDALAQEDLDKEPKNQEPAPKKKKKRRLKKATSEEYSIGMLDLLDKIQQLYPSVPKPRLWEAVKDRLTKKFPEINI